MNKVDIIMEIAKVMGTCFNWNGDVDENRIVWCVMAAEMVADGKY